MSGSPKESRPTTRRATLSRFFATATAASTAFAATLCQLRTTEGLMPRPESPLDIPCPVASCNAPEGSPCGDAKGPWTQPHRARVARLERAAADWDRLV